MLGSKIDESFKTAKNFFSTIILTLKLLKIANIIKSLQPSNNQDDNKILVIQKNQESPIFKNSQEKVESLFPKQTNYIKYRASQLVSLFFETANYIKEGASRLVSFFSKAANSIKEGASRLASFLSKPANYIKKGAKQIC